MVFADETALFGSEYGVDVGIGLESACNAEVVHNTVFTTQAPFSSIEYRFAATSGVIANNLVSPNIRDRGGTTISTAANLTGASAAWFEGAAAGDLHLSPTASSAIDAGDPSHGTETDIDGEPRDDGSPDVGADEL